MTVETQMGTNLVPRPRQGRVSESLGSIEEQASSSSTQQVSPPELKSSISISSTVLLEIAALRLSDRDQPESSGSSGEASTTTQYLSRLSSQGVPSVVFESFASYAARPQQSEHSRVSGTTPNPQEKKHTGFYVWPGGTLQELVAFIDRKKSKNKKS